VVTYTSTGIDGDSVGIYVRVFGEDGTPQTDDIQVNTFARGQQNEPSITPLADGGFAITYETPDYSTGSSSSPIDVMMRAFDADGTPRFDEVRVTGRDTIDQEDAHIAGLADGKIVVVYNDESSNFDLMTFNDAYARIYNADGTPFTDPFLLESDTHRGFSAQAAREMRVYAKEDGGFYTTYLGDGPAGSNGFATSSAIDLQEFSADGKAIGAPIVSPGTTNRITNEIQARNEGYITSDGTVRVVWSGYFGDDFNLREDVRIVEFSAGGTAATGTVTVTGIATQGETLTAALGDDLADADGVENVEGEWRWMRDGDIILGATGETYVLRAEDAGSTVRAEYIFVDDAGHSEVLSSAETATVANVYDAPVGSITLFGLPTQGQTLVADLDLDAPDGIADGTARWEWLRDGVAIQGATDSEYVLTDSDIGAVVAARYVFTTEFGVDEIVASDGTDAVAAAQVRPVRPPLVDVDADTGFYAPKIAADDNGNVLMIWTGQFTYSTFPAGEGGDLYGQWYGPDGRPLADAFTISDDAPTSSTTQIFQYEATKLANGNMVVSWGQGGQVRVQEVSLADGPTGTEKVLAQETDKTYGGPEILQLSNGSIAVVYYEFKSGSSHGHYDNYLAVYDSSFTLTAGPVSIDPIDDPWNRARAIAETSEGNILVSYPTYDDNGTSTSDDNITGTHFAVYDTSLGLLSTQFDDSINDNLNHEMLTLSSGTTVWIGQVFSDVSLDRWDIHLKLVDKDGNTSDQTVVVNNVTADTQGNPALVPTPDGGFIVAFSSNGQDGDQSGVVAQRFDATGTEVGGEFLLAPPAGNARDPDIVALPNNGYAVVYTGEDPVTGLSGPAFQIYYPFAGETTTNTLALTGTPTVGQTLTGTGTATHEDGINAGSVNVWLRDGVVIEGATGSTYTLTEDDVGAVITYGLSFSTSYYDDIVAQSSGTTQVEGLNADPVGQPGITGMATPGAPAVGETLMVSISGVTDADGLPTDGYTYQWYRGADAITGATSEQYEVTITDMGAVLSARITYTDQGGTQETVESSGLSVPLVNFAPSGDVTITGELEVGATLTANATGITDTNGINQGTLTYTWLRDGVDIPQANQSTYQLTGADMGRNISVRVDYTDNNNFDEMVTSTAVGPVEIAIAGTVALDATLTVDILGGGSAAPGTLQWMLDGEAIPNATGASYQVTPLDLTGDITVAFTEDGTGTVHTSDPVSASGPPTILSSANAASAELIGDGSDETALTYHWMASQGAPKQRLLVIEISGNTPANSEPLRYQIQLASGIFMPTNYAGDTLSTAILHNVSASQDTQYVTLVFEAETTFPEDGITISSQFGITEVGFDPEIPGTVVAEVDANSISLSIVGEQDDSVELNVDDGSTGADLSDEHYEVKIDAIDNTSKDFENFGVGDSFVFSQNGPFQINKNDAEGKTTISTNNGELDVFIDPNAAPLEGRLLMVELDGETHVSYQTYMPILSNERRIGDEYVNGVTNDAFVTGTTGVNFEISLVDLGSAAFRNSLGVYEVAEDGTISNIQLLYADVTASGLTDVTIQGATADSVLSFFLLQDAAQDVSGVTNTDTFEFVTQSGAAGSATGGEALFLSINGTVLNRDVFHSYSADLNIDGQEHVISGVSETGDEMILSFEDQTGGGDADYEDLSISIERIEIA
jgi:hypothetical protein